MKKKLLKSLIKETLLAERAYEEAEKRKLPPADRTLYAYVRKDGRAGPVPSDKEAETLMKKYPIDTPQKVYRGLMFEDERSYQKFLGEIEDGTLTTTGFTSWTPSKETAFQFAVTRPAFEINFGLSLLMNANPGELLVGKGGIIISTEISAGDGIAVSKAPYAAESEVLLKPKVWNVEVVKKISQFKKMIGSDGVNQVVQDLIKNNGWEKLLRDGDEIEGYETKGLFDYIFGHRQDELNAESRELIAEMLSASRQGRPMFHVELQKGWLSKDEIVVSVGSSLGLLATGFFGAPGDIAGNRKIKGLAKEVDKIVDAVIAEIKKNPDARLVYYGSAYSSLGKLVNYGSGTAQTKYAKVLRDVYGKKYHELNQPRIMNNPKEMEDLMLQLTDVLQSISA